MNAEDRTLADELQAKIDATAEAVVAELPLQEFERDAYYQVTRHEFARQLNALFADVPDDAALSKAGLFTLIEQYGREAVAACTSTLRKERAAWN